jgi:hypothetical protein
VWRGQQGIGKSIAAIDQAARETQLGHGVIFLAEEDSAGGVIRPRCEAAEADIDRVFIVDAVRPATSRRT